jgi:hypothetical protein
METGGQVNCSTIEIPATGSCRTVHEQTCSTACSPLGAPHVSYASGSGRAVFDVTSDDQPLATSAATSRSRPRCRPHAR